MKRKAPDKCLETAGQVAAHFVRPLICGVSHL